MTSNDLNSMSFDELVPSKSRYLAKADVGEDGLILTIKGFRMERIKSDDGADEEKTVLHFIEPVKPMVLNRTNSQLIGVATGCSRAGDAKGRTIVVYNDPSISMGGKVTGGLRIKQHRSAAAPKPAAPERVSSIDEGFDDMPEAW